MENTKRFFGCVADDFTGASDGASFLRKAGISTVLINGVPREDMPEFSAQAVVIALKSRTQKREDAVRDALKAFLWLEKQGVSVFYLKYCSTFDSSDEGNIGPVIDAVLEEMGFSYTVLCPSLPVNGRTVREGRLYVNGVLLEESHMKNHPLTPMTKSRLADLMAVQGKYPCVETCTPAREELWEEIKNLVADHGHCYVVPDYEKDEDGLEIARSYKDIEFFTGGSGLMEHLGAVYGEQYGFQAKDTKTEGVPGPTLLLAGSCSKITLEQIEAYKSQGHPFYQIQPERLVNGEMTPEDVWKEAAVEEKEHILIYSSAAPEEVKRMQCLGKENVADTLEKTMARLVTIGREKGIQKYVIAGGETSGAVMKALGYQGYHIGESIAPGVPVMTPIKEPQMRLVLKSGNFGQTDFFARTISQLKGEAI